LPHDALADLDKGVPSGIVGIPPTGRTMDRLYYTPREVAEALAVSDDAVLDLIHRGDLPALRVSPRIIRIPIAAFDLWREGVRPKRRRVAIRPSTRKVEIGSEEDLPERAHAIRR
jgi:excisionase family DNA binding protein